MKKNAFFHSPAFTIAAMIAVTLFAKALGLIRQMMTASIFAASPEGIAFSAASGIPLAVFDMLFSTAVLGSFLPIYKGKLTSDLKCAESFSSSFLSAVVLVTGGVALLGILLARPILLLAAPDLDAQTANLAVTLLRMMFPAVIFAGTAYTLVGILQSHERFLLPAFVSALSNLVMILYLAFCPKPIEKISAIGLAAAYLISWAVQFLTLAVPLIRQRKFPLPTKKILTSDTKLAAARSLPVMFGSWLIPMTSLIAKAFSSFIDGNTIEPEAYPGTAIVVYENAFSVFTIAAGLLTYGICNYIFPKLSERAAIGDGKGFSNLIENGMFASLALILPISAAAFILSEEIIALLYLRGSFTQGLASAAADALKVLSFAMPAYGMTELFSRVCYSCGKVRFPMLASLTGIAVSLLLNGTVLFSDALSVKTVSWATVLGQTSACTVLLVLCRLFFSKKTNLHLKKILLLFPGWAFGIASMWICRNFLRQILQFSKTFQNFLIITIVFTVGFMVYLIWLIGIGLFPVKRNAQSPLL
ncbi:MAG: polysaccharide biosynthesis C-terminal domain-containing protein [Clostridia bacterium]|nr:polysaccharide biosynthesis C-terminal domain-containing protein [Clostridia bacterium]